MLFSHPFTLTHCSQTRCLQLARSFGYSQFDLNCGCPSIESNAPYGAALMKRPSHVAALVDHMAHALHGEAPVSVKCRIGVLDSIDGRVAPAEDYASFADFVEQVTASGACRRVVVHARTAVLRGFSPADNREVPPLRYDFVTKLASDFPHLHIVLNGGIGSRHDFESVKNSGTRLAGVMAGRWCLRNPFDLLQLRENPLNPESIIDAYTAYAISELKLVSRDEAADLLSPIALVFMSIDRQINAALVDDSECMDDDALEELYSLSWKIIEGSIPLLTALDCQTHKIDIRDKISGSPPLRPFRQILGSVCGKKLMSKMKKNTIERIK